MNDDNHKVLKGVGKGLGQIGTETMEKLKEEGERILESTITGKQLLGLDRTMGEGELELQKHEDKQKSAEEIKKIKGEMGQNEVNEGKEQKEKGRDIEGEMKELRERKKKEEEEKEKYYEEERKKQEMERQRQEEEYNNSLMMESTNPAKQKKSRGSAFAGGKKKKRQPDQSQMSQTSEFKGKIN
jgi:type IV secretory pathway VirB10-like protein